MSLLRRIALGFPVSSWAHQRAWCVDSLAQPGARRYFIEWNPDGGVYGDLWAAFIGDTEYAA